MPVKNRVVPFEEIKEGGGMLWTGVYLVKIGEFDETTTKEAGKAMLTMPYTVEEPAEYAGITRTEYLVIGMDHDIGCDKTDTWKDQKNVGGKNLKRIAKAAKVSGVR
jgi:hypothetical protein